MILLYNFFLFFLFLLLFPYFLFRLMVTKRYRIGLGERLGNLSKGILKSLRGERPIWVHAVSVGELVAAKPLLKELRQKYSAPILLSTTTEAGYRIAKKFFPDLPLIFFPFDFSLIVKRFVRRIRPKIFITLESEIWPNLLSILKKRGIPAVLVNGRLSQKSYGKYRRFGFWGRRFFGELTRLGMRSQEEAERVIRLGVKKERVFVTGNLKYESALSLRESLINSATILYPDFSRDMRRGSTSLLLPAANKATTDSPVIAELVLPVVARFIKLKDSPVIVFGSLHSGEEEQIIESCSSLSKSSRLIFAPRHPEKSRIKAILKRKGLDYVLWSKIKAGGGKLEKEQILILDTIGELSFFYSLATLVFVGGTFIPWGGHNVIEPAVFSKPILFGPYMGNFWEESLIFKKAGAAIEVKDAAGLYSTISELLTNPEKIKTMGEASFQVVREHLGATEKNLSLIKDLLTAR